MYESTLKVPITKNDHHKGNIHSPIQIVEYADFQCPYCKAASPVMEELFQKYKKSLCFIYRHFPIEQHHPLATLAAVASEAAARQDKFWEMHEALFSNQEDLSENTILLIAKEINLDMEKFNEDMDDDALMEKVQNDFDGGIKSGVDGTPSVFVNGIRHTGDVNLEELSEEIEIILRDTLSDDPNKHTSAY